MRYYIWCDESLKKGEYYSNFYGGILINSTDYAYVNYQLGQTAEALLQDGEIKWSKVNQYNLKMYKSFINCLFDFVQEGIVKVRIMFTANIHKPKNIGDYQKEFQFHLLYYQFLKHSFGFKFLKGHEEHHLEIFFDKLPDKIEKNQQFKQYIYGLQYLPGFIEANVRIHPDSIMEVDSHKHILLQGLDVILGAMAFKLNKKDRIKPEGARIRGKRTRAKEELFKEILGRIFIIKPHFNPGITTGKPNGMIHFWEDAYRHWLFMPKEFETDSNK